MKSFLQYITELFDSGDIIPLTMVKFPPNPRNTPVRRQAELTWSGNWLVNGKPHRFEAGARRITLGSSDPQRNPEDPDEVVGWTFSFTIDGDYSPSAGQEAEMKSQTVRIFATALEAIRQLIKEYDPKTIRFSAEKDKNKNNSRVRLYDSLIRRFAAQHGYKLLQRSDDQFVQMYALEKK